MRCLHKEVTKRAEPNTTEERIGQTRDRPDRINLKTMTPELSDFKDFRLSLSIITREETLFRFPILTGYLPNGDIFIKVEKSYGHLYVILLPRKHLPFLY